MATSKRHTYLWNIKRSFKKYWPLYICLLLVLTYYVIFHYAPMMGNQMGLEEWGQYAQETLNRMQGGR